MPQPTRPASVRMVQYWPWRQRLLTPMAQPLANCKGREMIRGRGSLMGELRAGGRGFHGRWYAGGRPESIRPAQFADAHARQPDADPPWEPPLEGTSFGVRR